MKAENINYGIVLAISYFVIALLTVYTPIRKAFVISQSYTFFACYFFVIIAAYGTFNKRFLAPKNINNILIAYIVFLLFSVYKGLFIFSSCLSDYVNFLGAFLILATPCLTIPLSQRAVIQGFYRQLYKISFPLIIMAPLWLARWGNEQFLGIFLLWLPLLFLQRRRILKLIVIFYFIYVFVMYFDDRTMILRCGILLFLSAMVCMTSHHIYILSSLLRKIFLYFPLVCLALAFIFNINCFNIGEYLNINSNEHISSHTASVFTDSRSPLFREVWESAKNNNYIITGRSPARGNDTKLFREYVKRQKYGRAGERHGNEMLLTNIFTWMGLIGLFLYSAFSWYASWLGIYKSKNVYSKILGCIVASRWMIAWVEENGITIVITSWIAIALCSSPYIRSLTTPKLLQFANSIFNSKRFV